jgi:SAM-dependent methyltransferase
MIDVPCPVCGSAARERLVETTDYRRKDGSRHIFVRCLSCALVYLSPRPAPDELPGYYPPEYHDAWLVQSAAPRSPQHLLAQGRVSAIERLHPQPGSILDVGCGVGLFLALLHERGWSGTGTEWSHHAARRARETFNLTVHTGPLRELRPAAFDIVTLWHVVEHMHDPRGELREIGRLLAPGGRLVVATPNADSLALRVFGGAWYHLDAPRHLQIFSPASLNDIAARAGFAPVAGHGVHEDDTTGWMMTCARWGLARVVRHRGSTSGRKSGAAQPAAEGGRPASVWRERAGRALSYVVRPCGVAERLSGKPSVICSVFAAADTSSGSQAGGAGSGAAS